MQRFAVYLKTVQRRGYPPLSKNIGIMAFLLQNKGVLPFFIDFLAKM